jgi:phenylacetate-CoA ligase
MSFTGWRYTVYRSLPVFLQNLVVTRTGSRRWKHESSTVFQDLVSFLRAIQYSSPEVMREYQKERLARILLAAKQTDFYRDVLPADDEIADDPFPVLYSVPVLDKEDVRSDYTRFINRSFGGELIRHGTSGTTGTPLQTIWTRECIDMERALIWRQRMETGLFFGSEWRGILGGHRIVPLKQRKPPFWRANRGARQLYFSTFHISPATASHYLSALKDYEVKALEGYPSVLYALAYSMRQAGLEYRLSGIYYGAEPLQDFQKDLIEQVFQCYVWDYYGLTERNASASEFECRNGLHENWENCILEIVSESGDVLPEGEYGELAGTSLSNVGFPLLRYRTGDMTRFLPGACTCSRFSRRLARIDTKREDLLMMPDGSLLSASNLTFPFKEVGNILESQLYQEAISELQVRIVPAAGYTETDGNRLIAGLKEMLPDPVEARLVIVDEIPRTGSGKFRFCVSEITGGNRRIHSREA